MEIIKNEIGICFGGGGALGFAHLGVLKALEENNIRPYYVSGASMGAIIGALYAQGYNAAEIVQIVEEHKISSITNIISPTRTKLKAGFMGTQKVEKLLRQYIPHNSFEQLKRPFSLSVVNFRKAECVIVSSGNKLIEYILASMSVPLAFEPQIIDDEIYVDGGIMNNLPVEPLLPLCKKIIGVDVQTALPFNGKITKTNILPIAYCIMHKQMDHERAEKCNYYFCFEELMKFNISDFSKFKQIYQIGYKGASKYIQEHSNILLLSDIQINTI